MANDKNFSPEKEFEFIRLSIPKISTGSRLFDQLLGGGLPICCIADVFGAAATGKTQFCFQNAVTTCEYLRKIDSQGVKVLFVDCAGSFRPERIVEISENRFLDPKMVLENISSISVRSASAQIEANRRLEEDPRLSQCRLVIVDDVTSNFVSDYSKEGELPARQRDLSLYARRLSYLANRRGLSVLMSNSVRSRGSVGEGETTGEVLSSFALCRIHLSRVDRRRYAELDQRTCLSQRVEFEIGSGGIA